MIKASIGCQKAAKSKAFCSKVAIYICLILFSLFVLIPFYVILISSVKDNSESMNVPFTWWPKKGFHFEGYKRILFEDVSAGLSGGSSIMRGFLNTLWMALPTSIIGTLTSSVAAFAFAKIEYPGKKIMFSLLLATMMLPGIITLVPSYLIYSEIQWISTPFPIIIPGLFGGASCVFFMRQFFSGMPDELVDAAKIDGMNYLKIFFFVILPLSIPAFAAQALLWFIGMYNDYLGPLLYLRRPELYTLQIALKYASGTYEQNIQVIMSGCVFSILPIVVIYLFAQKYFIASIAMTGLKA